MRNGVLMAFRPPQDKAKVLEDVRGIISTQLGTDVEKVRRGACMWQLGEIVVAIEGGADSIPAVQVTPESKFVDLGADSLDTVSPDFCR